MKTLLHFKTIFVALLFLLATSFSSAQNYEASKTLNKTAGVPANVVVKISNKSGDIKINTTDQNVVSIKTEIKVSGKSESETNKIIQAIENFKFEANGGNVEIDTRFYKNMHSINNRRTITLLNGDKVRIREFKIRHEINIPKTASMKLENKYSDVVIDELGGSADLTLYSSKLNCRNFSQDVNIYSKYSKLNVQNILGDLDLDLYDTDIKFVSAGNTSIKSKYSKVEGEKVNSLVLDSYDDKFFIDNIDNLKFEAKYSDLDSEAELNNLELDLYDCNIKIGSAKKGSFSGKYSELKLGNVKDLKIPYSYDNDIVLGKTMSIQISESKYTDYEIGETAELSFSGYDDNVSISKLNTDFSGISMNGKYGKLEVNAGSVPFQVDFKIKYAKVDIPESVKVIKQVEKSSVLEMIGNESGGKIQVEGYDMKVVIE